MSTFELSQLLEGICPDSPCGENLEYDPVFQEMMREAKGVEEKQMGDSTIPAQAPDWSKVHDLALQLLERTRDIQITALLACALGHRKGLSGLDEGLTLTQGLLENFWDDVFPHQDPDDDYPMLRMNTLATLNDDLASLIRLIPLTASQGLGRFCWRDIEIAEGRLAHQDTETEPPTVSVIEAAFEDTIKTDAETFENKAASAKHALAQVRAMEALTKEKAGAEGAPELSTLIDLLADVSEIMEKHLQRHGQKASIGHDAELTEQSSVKGVESAAGNADLGSVVNNRNDVIRTLDSICDYFDRNEPSSPVPFLLRRAKKLINKDFLELLEDLAPDGINQAQSICGNKETGNA